VRGRVLALAAAALTAQAAVAARPPLSFVWPTSVAVEPGGSVLVVENGLRQLDRVDPRTGKETEVVTGMTKPYAVAATKTGTIFVTDAGHLLRIDGSSAPRKVASAGGDIGPIAVGTNGDVWFTTATTLYQLRGGKGRPVRVLSGLGNPHGLAVVPGGVLVSDTEHNRVLRVTGNTARELMKVSAPMGVVVAPDRTIDVVEHATRRVVRFSAAGKRLGLVGPAFGDPYALALGATGLFVDDTSPAGVIRLVAPDGRVSTL
jgi:streptogramin lyase